MVDAKLISFCDAVQTVIREIFEERGYHCDVSLVTEAGSMLKTSVKVLPTNTKQLTSDIVNSIVEEATNRVTGGNPDPDIFHIVKTVKRK